MVRKRYSNYYNKGIAVGEIGFNSKYSKYSWGLIANVQCGVQWIKLLCGDIMGREIFAKLS